MAETQDTGTTETAPASSAITIHHIKIDAPWAWLAAGWRDMWRIPEVSLCYGFLFAVVSLCLTLTLTFLQMSSLVIAMAAGFMLVGPLLAVGMYEASRRLENNKPVLLTDVLIVDTAAPAQLAFMGALLMIFLLVWIRIATLLIALFFGIQALPPIEEFVPTLLFTWHGLSLLIVGSAVGGVMAFVIFAATAISVPMLMVRDMDAVTAMLASIDAVRKNFWAMLLWAWLIALLTAFGIATLFAGLIVTFPLVGHATWHAYRALVDGAKYNGSQPVLI